MYMYMYMLYVSVCGSDLWLCPVCALCCAKTAKQVGTSWMLVHVLEWFVNISLRSTGRSDTDTEYKRKVLEWFVKVNRRARRRVMLGWQPASLVGTQ